MQIEVAWAVRTGSARTGKLGKQWGVLLVLAQPVAPDNRKEVSCRTRRGEKKRVGAGHQLRSPSSEKPVGCGRRPQLGILGCIMRAVRTCFHFPKAGTTLPTNSRLQTPVCGRRPPSNLSPRKLLLLFQWLRNGYLVPDRLAGIGMDRYPAFHIAARYLLAAPTRRIQCVDSGFARHG